MTVEHPAAPLGTLPVQPVLIVGASLRAVWVRSLEG